LAVAAENPKALVTGNKDIINQGKHAVSTNTVKDIVGRYTEVLRGRKKLNVYDAECNRLVSSV
jgi:hypothetical protein